MTILHACEPDRKEKNIWSERWQTWKRNRWTQSHAGDSASPVSDWVSRCVEPVPWTRRVVAVYRAFTQRHRTHGFSSACGTVTKRSMCRVIKCIGTSLKELKSNSACSRAVMEQDKKLITDAISKFPNAWKLNRYFWVTHTSEAASRKNTLNDVEMEMRPGKYEVDTAGSC